MEKKARSQQELKRSARTAPALHGVWGQLAAKSEQFTPAPAPSRRYEDNPTDLQGFIAALESGIEILREQQLSSHQRALRVLSLLKELIRRETGNAEFEDGLRLFFHHLGQSAPIAALLLDLYRRTRAVLYFSSRRKASLGFEAERVADELTIIADWYAQRKLTLMRWQTEIGPAAPFSIPGAHIFDLELMHDRSCAGAVGIEVHGSMFLVGCSRQSLWLKVFVHNQAGFVCCREHWHVWSDGSENLFSVSTGELRPVVAVAPLNPEAERVVVDNFGMFVPLRALDLPVGSHELVFDVEVSDQSGNVLCSRSFAGNVSIPRIEISPHCPPSPQALGIWATDLIRGDRISEIRIVHGFRGVLDRGGEVLSVIFDLELHGRAGDRVEAQCRFLDSAGYLVESCAAVLRDSNGAFLSQLTLFPASPVSAYFGLEMQVPLSCLKLEEGFSDLYCEISVLSPGGRLLCGALQTLDSEPSVTGERRLEERRLLSRPFVSDPCAEVELTEFLVDPAWHFDGHDTIRLKAVLSSEKWAVSPCRAVFSLEDAKGDRLISASVTDRWGRPAELVQCLCVGGYEAPLRQELVVNFDPDELPLHVFGRGSADGILLARLRVYSLDDRLQIETEQEFDFRNRALAETLEAEKTGQTCQPLDGDNTPSALPRRHNSLEHDAFIADILSRAYPVAGEVKFEIALNVNYLAHSSDEFLLYYEILDRGGTALGQPVVSSGSSAEFLTGCMKRVDVSRLVSSSLHSSGWFQVPVVLDLKLESIAGERQPLSLKDLHTVRVMLFSANGTLLQVASGGSSMLSGLDVYVDGNLPPEKDSMEQGVGAFLERVMPTLFGNKTTRKHSDSA